MFKSHDTDQALSLLAEHKYPVLAAILLLTLGFALGLDSLGFKSDYREFFEKTDPHRIVFDEMQDEFGSSDNIMFLLAPKSQNIYSQEVLQAVYELTDAAWQTPFSYRVDSLSNYQFSWSEQDDLMVEDLVPDPDALDPQKLGWIQQAAFDEPGILGRLVNQAGSVTAVNILVNVRDKPASAEEDAVAFAYQLKSQFEQRYPDLQLYLLGEVMVNATFNELYKEDMTVLVPVMIALILLMAMVALKSIYAAIIILIVVLATLLISLGSLGWLEISLTSPSSAAPIIIATLAIADSVHVLSHYLKLRLTEPNNVVALSKALNENAKAVFYTSVTTIVGFLSLNASDSPPFQDLGNFVSVGVAVALILTFTLLPALILIFPLKGGATLHYLNWGKWTVKVQRVKQTVLLVTLMVLIVSGFGMAKNQFNDDWVAYFDQDVPFRQAVDFSEQTLNGTTTLEFVFSGESITKPDFLVQVDNFAHWLKKQPETRHVFSFTDIFKRLNKNMHGDNPAHYRLPDSRELAAQYLLLYEMSLPFGLDINTQISLDKQSMRLSATFANLSSSQLLAVEARIAQQLLTKHPQLKYKISSPSSIFAHLSFSNIRGMLAGTAIAVLIIALILALALRSWKLGLLSIIPNMLPAFVAFGVWGVVIGEINLGLSIVTSMTMGIVVDDTVHFLTHYKYAIEHCGCDRQDALTRALQQSGHAIIVTTLILMLGFVVLATSDFSVNANLGILTAVTLAIAIIGDLIVLPALLLLKKN